MNRMNKVFFTLLLLFCFILTGLPLVSAQETSEEEFTLEEITVTAQKRVENQQKVAISMETIKGDTMNEMGMNNIDEILSSVSNAIINTSQDGMRIALRGVAETEGINKQQTTSTPTVAVNIDGAYNSNNNAAQSLFDVERVEVLVGPQSTMYASNSPGGIVNVVTAAPKTDKFSTSGTVEFGSYNLRNMSVAINAPVVQDMIALRLAANWTKRDSYVSGSDSTSAEDTKSTRLKALYQPNDSLSFTVTGNWSKRGGGGGMGASVEAFGNQDDVDDPWTAATVEEGPGGSSGGNTDDNTTKGISGEMAWTTGIGSLTVVPSYSKSNSSSFQTATDGEQSYSKTENTQKGVEARMTSSKDFAMFTWILGANWYKSADARITDYVEVNTYDESNTNSQNTKALFGNVTYSVTDKFRTTAGYRRSWDTTSNIEKAQNGAGGTTNSTTTTEQEYSSPDYKFGVEYDLADNAMLYADRSTSYRVNGLGMTNTSGEEPPPEKMVSYTIGSKNRFLNNKLQVNISAFYYDYKNKKANQSKSGDYYESDYGAWGDDGLDADFDDSGAIGDYDSDDDGIEDTYNVHDQNSQAWGSFRSYGLDVSTSMAVTANDRVNLSVSYLNAKWTELSFHYQYYMVWPDEDYSGEDNTYSPTISATASYEHTFALWNGGILTPHVDAQYQSSYILAWLPVDATAENKAYAYQEAHTMWNASATYAHANGMWTLNAYVKNIMNYALKTSYMDMGGSYSMGLNDPRTYGAVLSVKF